MTELPGLVAVLKFVMLLIMVGGVLAVFRELIPMARGARPVERVRKSERHEEE